MSASETQFQAEMLDFLRADVAGLVVDLFILSIAFSVYVPIFGSCVYALTHSTKAISNRRTFLWISVALFLFNATSFALYIVYMCLSIKQDLSIDSPYSINPHFDSIIIWRSILYLITVELADGVFVYRLYHVWGRKWYIIIPPILCMLSSPAIFLAMQNGSTRFWQLLQVTLSVALNVYITGLITYKVWQNDRAMNFLGRPRINRVIIVLLESAGIYTVFALAAELLRIHPSSQLQFSLIVGLQESLAPIIGIAYSLMIILVVRGRNQDIRYTTATSLHFNHDDAASATGIESVVNGTNPV